MSRIISQTTTVHQGGSVETVTLFESGMRITSFSTEVTATPRRRCHRPRPGDDGLRQAIRVIDARVERGEITAAEAVQREEDLITRYDRAGW